VYACYWEDELSGISPTTDTQVPQPLQNSGENPEIEMGCSFTTQLFFPPLKETLYEKINPAFT